ncbi:sporozoite surface protein 2-like [Girardinichthys multiradiatus]|uniref:sporozoite surface protein 2-like n=1 Tax=Girardinichthys multiradiatus TaxID=208333 RepID=UPI001FABA974|nr:sporozoite surface protein 2-like [Girardinichthys multiradiatus]
MNLPTGPPPTRTQIPNTCAQTQLRSDPEELAKPAEPCPSPHSLPRQQANSNADDPTSKKRTQPCHPTCCNPSTPHSSLLHQSPPGHDSQQSSTPTSPPNHPANVSNPSLPVHERETSTSQVTRTGRPTAPDRAHPPAIPVQAQDILHPLNRSPAPRQGPEQQKEALEEGHHSPPKTGHPANPTPKPRRCPCMPVTHTPARHTLPHQAGTKQAGRLSPPPKQSHIPINATDCLAKPRPRHTNSEQCRQRK